MISSKNYLITTLR